VCVCVCVSQMSAPYGQMPFYGGAPLSEKHSFVRLYGTRLNIWGICKCFFLPWCLFLVLFALLSFSPHFTNPGFCHFVILCGLLALVNAATSAYGVARKKREGTSEQEPTWHVCLTISLLVALIGGVVCGDSNFRYNMQPYYDFENLSVYPNVSAAAMTGDQFMDFGRLQFDVDTSLDLTKSMGFRNLEMYCVAPIVTQKTQMTSYDFWAVGTNCCSGTADFRCGEYNNPEASAGLRLLSESDRAFYRLAVQQAESTFNIKSTHPLFVYWMEDPLSEINSYQQNGFKCFVLGMIGHFVLQLTFVVLVTNWSAKLGRR